MLRLFRKHLLRGSFWCSQGNLSPSESLPQGICTSFDEAEEILGPCGRQAESKECRLNIQITLLENKKPLGSTRNDQGAALEIRVITPRGGTRARFKKADLHG